MTRVTLAYARATRSPRVYRKAKAEFELTPSGQVMGKVHFFLVFSLFFLNFHINDFSYISCVSAGVMT